MDLSIIIVNWNSARYVENCLRALYRNAVGVDFETIVVDNGSFDSCQKMIADKFPGVRFLQSERNLGFAQANNFGARMAHGEFLLFLNPDTEIIGNAVKGMLLAIKGLPRAGILGCKLLNTDMTYQTSCRQPFPTILNQVFDSDILHRLLPDHSPREAALLSKAANLLEVQVISGACMMIRKTVFEEVGGFSSEYFMYTEDVDLCFKVRRAGYANYYLGDVSIVHHGGGSSNQRKENSYGNVQMRESIFKFLKKTRGESYAYLYKLAMLLNGVMRFCIILPAALPNAFTGRFSRSRASLLKWTSIIRWTLGIEKWAR